MEDNEKKSGHSNEDLNTLYKEAEQADSELFSEQRSNLLLIQSEHYTKKDSKYWSRIRDNKTLNTDTKLRLTKNHLQRISKHYVNQISRMTPGVHAFPQNEKELRDQKIAEQNNSVIQKIKTKHKLNSRRRRWSENHYDVGEVAVKITWNHDAGEFVGWEQEVDENGQPVFETDEMGMPVIDQETGQPQPKASDRPVMSGDLEFEDIYGFDLLRAPNAKSAEQNDVWIYRRMAKTKELKKQYEKDPDKIKFIQSSANNTFTVFDSGSMNYFQTKDMTLVMEFYFRPCMQYPNGYFYIKTDHGVLEEGELPFGIFPIVYGGHESIPTSPRHRSPIKHQRPYQREINRAASAIATQQITLGDDKLLIQSGSKLGQGGTLPGVRGVTYTGKEPQVLAGRSGAQYLEYMESQIKELYQVANVPELLEEEQDKRAKLDIYAMLMRSMNEKAKYVLPAERFGAFLVEVYEVALETFQRYCDPQMHFVPYVGKHELVNLEEYKNQDRLCVHIKIEETGDDVETKLGKTLEFQQILQYGGPSLLREDVGRIIRAMPHASKEKFLEDLTIDYDCAVNTMLAMDRGEYPAVDPNDNHEYMIKKITNRMRQSDFKTLSPQIQQAYMQRRQEHDAAKAEELMKIKQAQSEFIPVGGYLVTCDFYVQDPQDAGKTRRARLPYESLSWLIKQLESQGSAMDSLEKLDEASKAGVADALLGRVSKQFPQNEVHNSPPIPANAGGMNIYG